MIHVYKLKAQLHMFGIIVRNLELSIKSELSRNFCA